MGQYVQKSPEALEVFDPLLVDVGRAVGKHVSQLASVVCSLLRRLCPLARLSQRPNVRAGEQVEQSLYSHSKRVCDVGKALQQPTCSLCQHFCHLSAPFGQSRTDNEDSLAKRGNSILNSCLCQALVTSSATNATNQTRTDARARNRSTTQDSGPTCHLTQRCRAFEPLYAL